MPEMRFADPDGDVVIVGLDDGTRTFLPATSRRVDEIAAEFGGEAGPLVVEPYATPALNRPGISGGLLV